MLRILVVALFIFFGFGTELPGQSAAVENSLGKPIIRHYTSKEYQSAPQCAQIAQLPNGMIYMTNKEVFTKVYDKAKAFFSELNKKLRLTNIALHSEFKLSDELIPIEINAMRFGGMGLGNMIYHSLGVNAYEHFILEKTPDWDQIWKDHSESNFVYFIAYNGSKIDKNEKSPDFDKLERRFTRILNKTKFDYKTQLAFAVYTLEESKENIGNLLTIDFNDYFSDKDDSTNR